MTPATRENRPPNIIFVFSDQQRADTMGCYGQKLPVTPNLDAIAASGVLFENTFTPQPVCGPARSCLQTGMYATETGCFRNGIALPTGMETLATWLSRGGYEVGYIGKWHLASTSGSCLDKTLEPGVNFVQSPVPPERRGGYVDFWLASDVLEHTSHGYEGGFMFDGNMNRVDFKGYRVDGVTDFVIDYLATRDGKRPFFLFLSYIEPHHQNDRNRYEGPPGSKEKFRDFDVPGDLAGTQGDWRESYPDYLGCCSSIDANVHRITEKLEQLGLARNTLLIYTSDHGSHFRTRNNEYKRSCHDSSIHVPLVIKGPGFLGGKRISEMVSLMDLIPTILHSAGVDRPAQLRGRPLQDIANGTAKDWPDEIFVQISESQVGRAIRTRKWKYSIVAPGKNGALFSRSGFYVDDCLYDLEHDPHERENMIDNVGLLGVKTELARRLKEYMINIGEDEPRILFDHQMPKNVIEEVTGKMHVDNDGLLLMDVYTLPSRDGIALPVPLAEILEPAVGHEVVVECHDTRFEGKVIVDGTTLALSSGGSIVPFEKLLGNLIGSILHVILDAPGDLAPGDATGDGKRFRVHVFKS